MPESMTARTPELSDELIRVITKSLPEGAELPPESLDLLAAFYEHIQNPENDNTPFNWGPGMDQGSSFSQNMVDATAAVRKYSDNQRAGR